MEKKGKEGSGKFEGETKGLVQFYEKGENQNFMGSQYFYGLGFRPGVSSRLDKLNPFCFRKYFFITKKH